jgi:hypothetical protein
VPGAGKTLSRIYLFVAEAGNLDFSPKGSRYFILTSVAIDDGSIGNEILKLHRELAWAGADITGAFHASVDKQFVRDEVFKIIGMHRLRIDATIFEKARARPHFHQAGTFYERAWYLHMKYVAPRAAAGNDEMHVIGASFGTHKSQLSLTEAVQGVIEQVWQGGIAHTSFWSAGSDPC